MKRYIRVNKRFLENHLRKIMTDLSSILCQCNQHLQHRRFHEIPLPLLYKHWIWDTDPNEELPHQTLMNANHLTGLLYCRTSAAVENSSPFSSAPSTDKIQLHDCPPSKMNLMQLTQTLDNICLEWPQYIRKYTSPQSPQVKNTMQFVHSCLVRFGNLASHAWDPSILNNTLWTEEYDGKHVQMTVTAMRRILNTLLILLRHFHWFLVAVQVPPVPFPCSVRKPHMEASMEPFDLLCMHFLIPVGARLRYKNDFRGMYNHVSQVMYFHNPDFVRLPRISIEMVENPGDPVQVLPALWELHPDMPTYYEEDFFFHKPKLDHWAWLVVAGRIYLLSPEKKVFWSSNITALYRVFKEKLNETVYAHS